MRTAATALMMLVACYRPSSKLACSADGSCSLDDSGVTPVDASLVCGGNGNGLLSFPAFPCFDPSSLTALNVTTRTVNTGEGTDPGDCSAVVSQPAGPELCVLAFSSVSIAGAVTAIGARPLVLWSADDILIADLGIVDVASHTTTPGPGTGDLACVGSLKGGDDPMGGGGGAGGTLKGRGGAGGPSINSNTGGNPVGVSIDQLPYVRGGCHGGAGGQGNVNGAGAGGFGGGAIYFMAVDTITVAGDVNASGGGGGRPGNTGGGGGGGSGGVIVFDAPTVTIEATANVFALGGGGACGGNQQGQGGESSGREPSGPTVAAGGAIQTVNSNSGGAGSSQIQRNGVNGGQVETLDGPGGGGGGGGSGFIEIFTATLTSDGSFGPPFDVGG